MFKDLYKANLDLQGTQEERRQLLLEKQKEERRNLQDGHRSLEDAVLFPLNQKTDVFKPKSNNDRNSNWRQKQQEKLKSIFRETHGVELSLQQSEWLREFPGNLCDWLLVPCPRGQRCLVVAHNHQTVVFNKLGRCVCVFRSMLPGDGLESNSFTILDCIYLREQNAFYVLDVLAFGGTQNLLYCEAEFRFFWLRSKWEEMDGLKQRSAHNQKPFYLVKQYDFENMPSIAEAFQRYPLWPNNKPELDGFLFYHRFANYTCGTTPLVGWLFAFMVPDVLKMQINENYKKPDDYVDPIGYMDQFDEVLSSKWKRSQEREDKRLQRMNAEVNTVDVEPVELSIDDKCEKNPFSLNEAAECDRNAECLMCDEENPDSDEENPLKKLIEAQRKLETLPDSGGAEIKN